VELDVRGLNVIDRKTGLVVQENIPKYIKIGACRLIANQNGRSCANGVEHLLVHHPVELDEWGDFIAAALRMLYSAGFVNRKKSVQRFLKKMTIKEGLRMDTRESCAQIRPFIKIHGLDPSEWLLPCMPNVAFRLVFANLICGRDACLRLFWSSEISK
jgi:hypothetical protein